MPFTRVTLANNSRHTVTATLTFQPGNNQVQVDDAHRVVNQPQLPQGVDTLTRAGTQVTFGDGGVITLAADVLPGPGEHVHKVVVQIGPAPGTSSVDVTFEDHAGALRVVQTPFQ